MRLIGELLAAGTETLAGQRRKVIELRQEMWENTAHASQDFTKLTEMNQYLSDVNSQTAGYLLTSSQVKRYRQMIDAPYFGRLDFKEANSRQREKLYIGLDNVIDPKTQAIRVYDWRAPISSLFYQYELGQASYQAPMGEIKGEILLKRQYNIKNSQLLYFFDCSVRITDELLQEILSHNSSPHMRTIVETIQKEQDLIIRDTTYDLLLVQGAAGSGKTSIALHRVAFLLYRGLSENLDAQQVLIISPTELFKIYISQVLPSLGEENVRQTTFQQLAQNFFEERFHLEPREEQLESSLAGAARQESIAFKNSEVFLKILQRLLWHYAHRLVRFEDLSFGSRLVAQRQTLKNRFLNNPAGIPLARQLKRLEKYILSEIQPLQKKRLQRIQLLVAEKGRHPLEVKSFSRLLSIKKTRSFLERLKKMTTVDWWQLYLLLFQDRELFFKLAVKLELPPGIEDIVSSTRQRLERGEILYEDAAPLLYLFLRVEGSALFSELKHVVIDEAQDYGLMHFAVFKLLFPNSRYTVLGDLSQSIGENPAPSFYDDLSAILEKPKCKKIVLTKGYRSTYEINSFAQQLLNRKQIVSSFARHGQKPQLVSAENRRQLLKYLARDARQFKAQGYESVAIICKTQAEAAWCYSALKGAPELTLIGPGTSALTKGVTAMPVYLAKGLEFDAVLVCDANAANYSTEFERRLLYVACSRALHQLKVYYTGQPSPFLPVTAR